MQAARPFVVRLALALIAVAGLLCACGDRGGSGATDRQAEYEGLLAGCDRLFIQYLARAARSSTGDNGDCDRT